MKTQFKFGALCAAITLSSNAVQAFDVLHIANSDSPDYSSFIVGKSGTWTHVASGLTATGTVGGDLDRVTDFPVNGTHGGTGITVKSYLESFDLIIIGNNVSSGNFVHTTAAADWAGLSKPVLFHTSLVARGTGNRPGMFLGDNNLTFTYGVPDDTLRISTSALSDAIFSGVTTGSDLYDSFTATFVETISIAGPPNGSFGGGELITSLSDGVNAAPPRGIVYWNAGVTNGVGQTLAGKRAFLPLRNAVDSSSDLSADGKLVLGNLIDQLLLPPAEVIFLPPNGLVAKSGVESINLSWSGNSTATSYNVKRSLTAGGPYETITTPGAVTGTTYSDTGLTNGTTYYYVVSAVDDSPVLESVNSAEVSAVPVPSLFPAINILFVANGNSAAYENFAANGQFAANTWTQKGTGLTGNDVIGGDLSRVATFTGTNGGTMTVQAYLESFDLVIVGVPTTSLNFVDGANGAAWASVAKPILFHPNTVARAASGRVGLFSQDNFLTFTYGTPNDTVKISSSALAEQLFTGVTNPSDLYASLTNDVVNDLAFIGSGEEITKSTNGMVDHHGLVFWAEGDVTGGGRTVAANRAFLPLKGTVDDLNADGKIVLTNLINQMRVPQTTPENLYAEWAANNISSLNLFAAPGFDQDGDNDGLLNGLEWTLGGDPLTSDLSTVLPTSMASAADGLTLVFNRTSDSVASTSLSVEWDTGLAGFNQAIPIGTTDVGPNGNNPTVDIDAPASGQVTVRIPAANAPGGTLFARVKAVLNP